MQIASSNETEIERLQSLRSYDILDSLSESDYDEITQLASYICGTKISLISLIDDKRQWFKSAFGTEVRETPKDYAFCTHAMQNPNEIFIVSDLRIDARFANNPLVVNDPNVVFYAGMPLVNKDGYPMGSLCVLDTSPKSLSVEQVQALKIMAKQVTRLFEIRKTMRTYKTMQTLLQERIRELEKF